MLMILYFDMIICIAMTVIITKKKNQAIVSSLFLKVEAKYESVVVGMVYSVCFSFEWM